MQRNGGDLTKRPQGSLPIGAIPVKWDNVLEDLSRSQVGESYTVELVDRSKLASLRSTVSKFAKEHGMEFSIITLKNGDVVIVRRS